jgi:hypothetical protein
MGRWVAIALASLMAAFLVLGVDWIESDAPGDAAAARALTAVTSASFDQHDPRRSFPRNWRSVMGYNPGVTTGPHGTPILIKPTGGCSAPVIGATRYNFDAVCKEHDLAYDVLRYSQAIGHPLPAGARRAADDMFGRELHARCDQQHLRGLSFDTCHTLAESFVDIVRVNSWRQGFRPPGTESGWQWLGVVLLALSLLGLRVGHRVLSQRATGYAVLAADLPPVGATGWRDRLLPGILAPPPPGVLRPRPAVVAAEFNSAAA